MKDSKRFGPYKHSKSLFWPWQILGFAASLTAFLLTKSDRSTLLINSELVKRHPCHNWAELIFSLKPFCSLHAHTLLLDWVSRLLCLYWSIEQLGREHARSAKGGLCLSGSAASWIKGLCGFTLCSCFNSSAFAVLYREHASNAEQTRSSQRDFVHLWDPLGEAAGSPSFCS